MKALFISGSPRKNGNTEQLLGVCAHELEQAGMTTEVLSLAGKNIRGCTGCGWCREHQSERRCVMQNDDFQPFLDKMIEADIIVVGSPVYFGSATPETMALLHRAGYVCRSQRLLERKIGGAIAVARRAGQNFTFAQLLYWFLINEMIVPGSSYWNIAIGKDKGDALNDEEGVKTIKRFAENMAWLAEKLSV